MSDCSATQQHVNQLTLCTSSGLSASINPVQCHITHSAVSVPNKFIVATSHSSIFACPSRVILRCPCHCPVTRAGSRLDIYIPQTLRDVVGAISFLWNMKSKVSRYFSLQDTDRTDVLSRRKDREFGGRLIFVNINVQTFSM